MNAKKRATEGQQVVETRLVEVWCNRVLQCLGTELKLNPLEALLVLRETAGYIEKTTGARIDSVALIPDAPPTIPDQLKN